MDQAGIMGIEVEKKYRLADNDVERLQTALKEVGAEFVGREFEENIIFSSGALRENASIVRIRKVDGGALLTFKRRVQSGFDVKQQIEYEVRVSNAEDTAEILRELGLSPALIYEKHRDTWNFKSVEIVIDELPFGRFMEIEGMVTGIREAEMLLDIDDLEVEHETYPALTARLGRKVGDVIEARFS